MNTETYTFTTNPKQDAVQASITIIVNAIPTTIVYCDSSNMPVYMAFDWATIFNAGFYEFSYSIDGGPQITARHLFLTIQFSVCSQIKVLHSL